MCRALANNSKCQDNTYMYPCIPKSGRTFPDLVGHFIIVLKSYISWLPGCQKCNVRAFSEFHTLNAKMPGKCPVSDCCLELCMCYIILIVLVVVFLLIMSSLISMN